MNMTRLVLITGRTLKDLKSIPAVALTHIIEALENRLYNCYHTRQQREEIEYQIMCYNVLLKAAK